MYRCLWFLPNVCGSYQMSGVLTRCQGVLPNACGSSQMSGFLPDVKGSYQMSGALPRVSWFHTGAAGRCRWWEGGVRSKLPAVWPRKGGCLSKKIIVMWQLFPKLSVSSVVWFVLWEILSHLTMKDKTGMCSTTKIDVLLSLTMLWKMKFRVGVLRFKPQGTLNWGCSSWCSGGLEKKNDTETICC